MREHITAHNTTENSSESDCLEDRPKREITRTSGNFPLILHTIIQGSHSPGKPGKLLENWNFMLDLEFLV